MDNVKTNTVLDTLGTLFVSLAGFCIAQINSARCDITCVFICALSFIIGIALIYVKYKYRENGN